MYMFVHVHNVCVCYFLLLRFLLSKCIPSCPGKIFSFCIEQCAGDTMPPTRYSFNVTKSSWADSTLIHEIQPQVPENKTLDGIPRRIKRKNKIIICEQESL